MRAKELRQKTKGELEELFRTLLEQSPKLRFQLIANQLKNVHQYRSLRRDIARISTLLEEAKSKEKNAQ